MTRMHPAKRERKVIIKRIISTFVFDNYFLFKTLGVFFYFFKETPVKRRARYVQYVFDDSHKKYMKYHCLVKPTR